MRNAIGWLLRIFSYLFHLILCLFLLGIAFVANSSGRALKLDILPWDGEKLNQWVLGLALLGLISLFLAATGLFRYLFPLWTLFVFVMLARGFFASGYNFAGEDAFKGALWLTFGALGAFLSSLSLFESRSRRR